jgi:transposase
MIKKAVAKELFLNGKDYKDIAKLLSVKHTLVRKWASSEKWNNLGVKKCKVNNKVGRPCKYESHVKSKLDKILEWKSLGFTDREISKKCGVGFSNFCDYKKKYSELKEIIEKGTINFVDEIEDILHKKALGQLEDITEVINYDEKGNIVRDYKTGIAKTVTKVKKVDTTANIFINKQKRAEKYNKELMHRIDIDHKKLEQQKYVDEEKLKIEREKIDKGIDDKPVINIDLSGLKDIEDI